jgi:hypothetical protein
MTLILGQLLEQVYREIHADVVDGVATGGSATTIVDTGLTTQPFVENRFKNWVAFISRSTDGASPQSKYGIVTSYVKATGTITLPTLTDSVQLNDEYSLCKPDVPLYTLIKLCNDGLNGLFYAALDTSLTSSGDETRYTLPLAVKGMTPYQIFLRDSSDIIYPAPNFHIETAAPGSAETLVFESQPAGSMTIVIDYKSLHPQLTTYSSSVSEKIHPRLALAACVERALHWKMMPKQRKLDVQNWQDAKRQLEEMKVMHKIEKPIRQQNMLNIGLYN